MNKIIDSIINDICLNLKPFSYNINEKLEVIPRKTTPLIVPLQNIKNNRSNIFLSNLKTYSLFKDNIPFYTLLLKKNYIPLLNIDTIL